ncbi:autotransporter-associated beta strand repeat-containing protein, partial [Desulfococcaceae bacterium OttesenSCG-928-F15]|nr:autotransporter-associated beta strand repeat-containing protein [Desulfococcaceae bacterium OttesenSCG-928-F15]
MKKESGQKLLSGAISAPFRFFAVRSAKKLFTLLIAVPLLAAVIFLSGTQNASAADGIYWNVTTGKWEVAENWDLNRLPTASDDVYIDNGGTVTIGSGVTGLADTLTVGDYGTGVLNLSGGGNATSASGIYLGFDSGSSGTVTVGSGSTLSSTNGNIYVGGNDYVAGGRGLLAGTGTVTADGSTGVLVYNTGTLSPGDHAGDIGELTITGKLDLQAGATVQLDYASGGAVDHIKASGDVAFGGSLNISLSSLAGGSIANASIITSTGGTMGAAPNATLLLNGLALTNSRAQGSTLGLGVSGNNLQLTLNVSGNKNKNLTWNAGKTGDQNWDITTENWTDNDNAGAAISFLDGDAVSFNIAEDTSITILGTQKTVYRMSATVAEGKTLDITGNIFADGSHSTLTGTNGSLVKNGLGSLTLKGDSYFAGSITVNGGELGITGGTVKAGETSLGENAGASGKLTVDGQGSLLDIDTKTLYVGYSGTGELGITGGGKVTAGAAVLGNNNEDASGKLRVDGQGSLLDIGTNLLYVGYNGTGELGITGGGEVTAGLTFLGYGEDASGKLRVDGQGSLLDLGTNSLYVGYNGTGELAITDGGKVMAETIWLGDAEKSNGKVTVAGQDSSLEVVMLYVGNYGSGELAITGGGKVAAEDTFLGRESSGSGSIMVGDGSAFTSTGSIYVGGSRTIPYGRGLLAGTGTVEADVVMLWNTGTISAGDKAGEIGTLTIDGKLDLKTSATVNFDYASGGSVAGTHQDHIKVTGDVTLGTDLNISLGSLAGGNIVNGVDNPRTIITAGGSMYDAPTNATLLLNGLALTNSRATGTVTLAKSGDTELQITELTITNNANKKLRWKADKTGDQIWDITTENWTDAANAATKFLDGDWVIFNTSTDTTITIDGTQKTVAQMDANITPGKTLTINGNIYADASQSTLSLLTPPDGKLHQSGGGTLVLNGNNDFAAGISIASGTLRLLSAGAAGSPAIDNHGRLELVFDGTFANPIFGSGAVLVKPGAGKGLTLTATNTYSGGTTIESGTLRLTHRSAAGSSTVEVKTGSSLELAFANDDFDNTIKGAGALLVNPGDGNSVTLTSTSSDYTGGTSVESGKLVLEHTKAAGTGPMALNAGTSLELAFTGDYANTISGAGNLIVKPGAGQSLTLTAANTYTGDTTVDNGTLTLTGSLGGGNYAGNIVSTGDLVFNQSAAQSLSGKISGAGSIYKSGTGSLSLSGDSSVYSGYFVHEKGSLALAGTAKLGGAFVQETAASLSSADGAELNHATFKGSVTPTGTLHVKGTASFEDATLELGSVLAGNKIAVAGGASFASTTVNIDLAGAQGGSSYTLLTYGSVTDKDVTINASNLGTRRGGAYVGATALSYELLADGAATLSWNGTGSNSWEDDDASQAVWERTGAGNPVMTWFRNGDNVIFGAAATQKTIAVDAVGVSLGTMNVNDDYAFTGGKITAGAVSVAAGKSLGLVVSDSPALEAASLDFNTTGKLNVTGYTPGVATDSFSAPFAKQTIIKTTGGISTFTPIVTVADQPNADFLSASARVDGKDVVVETGLRWYSTDSIRKALGTFTIADGSTFTLGAVLATNTTNLTPGWNGDSLIKEGTGTLVLTAQNTYAAGTTVNGGTLGLTNKDASGTGEVAVSSGSTLELAFGGTSTDLAPGTYANKISGDGALTAAAGEGKILGLTNGSSDYTGGTTVKSGTLSLTNKDASGTGEVAVSSGSTLELAFGGTSTDLAPGTYANKISGDGALTAAAGEGKILGLTNGSSDYTGGTTVKSGTLRLTDKGATGSGEVAVSSGSTLELAFDGIYANKISGDGALTAAAGAGNTIHLSAANTYTGGTTISEGGLTVTGSLGNGNYAGAILNAGSLTFNQTAAQTLSGVVIGDGTLTKTGSGILTLGDHVTQSQVALNDGSLVLASDKTITGAFTGAAGKTLQIGGGNTITGNASFGSGMNLVAALTDTNTAALAIDGSLTVDTTFNLNVTGTLNNGTYTIIDQTTGTVDFTGKYVGKVNGSDPELAGVNIRYGGQKFDTATEGKLKLIVADVDGNHLATWNKVGGGNWNETEENWTLDGNSPYKVFKKGDSVKFEAAGAGIIFVAEGMSVSTMTVDNTSGSDYTFVGNAITSTGAFTKSGTGTVTFDEANNFASVSLNGGRTNVNAAGALGSGSVSMNGASLGLADALRLENKIAMTGAGSFAVDTGAAIMSGVISGNEVVTKTGSGDLTLSATNTNTGGIVVSAGKLIGNTNSLQGDIANNASLEFNQGGAGTYAGNLSGAGSLTKTGTGILTLSGTNTYTGNTTVSQGGLKLDSNLSSSEVSVSSGAALEAATAVTLKKLTTAAGATIELGLLRDANTITTLAADIKTGTNVQLDATGISSNQTFTLIDYGTLTTGSSVTVLARNLATDYRGGHYFDNGDTALKYEIITGNTSLYWAGSSGSFWNMSLQNWRTDKFATYFKSGDTVTFSGGVKYVRVDGGGVNVKDMTVSGADYVFAEGNISGTGVLAINESATFKKQFDFTGGATIASGKTLTIDTISSDELTLSTNLSGVGGSLTKAGGGTLTLTGVNTYSGGTTVSGGYLAGNTNSLQGTIENNARLRFVQDFDGTYSGSLSGSGTFYKGYVGDLTLEKGVTQEIVVINGGSLSLAEGIELNSRFQGDENTTLKVKGGNTITGKATFGKNGEGMKLVAALTTPTTTALTIGGELTVIDTLNVDVTGTLENGSYTLIDHTNATKFDFTGRYIGKVNGAAPALNGPNLRYGGQVFDTSTQGKLKLIVASDDISRTATWNSAVPGGTWNEIEENWTLTDSAYKVFKKGDEVKFEAAGAGAITVAEGMSVSTMAVTGGTYSFGGNGITSTGAFTQSGGNVTFNVANDFNSASLTGGTTTLNHAGGLGNGPLTMDNATLGLAGWRSFTNKVTLAGSNSISVADGAAAIMQGIISGAGSLTKTGGGDLILSGANSYTGGTTVSEGTLIGNLNSLQGNILNNANLRFEQSSDGTYSGNLSGSGAFIKMGLGNLSLAQDLVQGAVSLNEGSLTLAAGKKLDSTFVGSMDTTLTVNGGNTITGNT